MSHSAIRKLPLSSLSKIVLAISAHRFNTLGSTEVREMHDCYILEFPGNLSSIHCVDSNGPSFSVPLAVIDHCTE